MDGANEVHLETVNGKGVLFSPSVLIFGNFPRGLHLIYESVFSVYSVLDRYIYFTIVNSSGRNVQYFVTKTNLGRLSTFQFAQSRHIHLSCKTATVHAD